MRLHAKIAVNASGSFMGRFPELPCDIDEMCNDNGGLDIAKVRSALKDYDELITWSKDDDSGTIAFAVELMRQLANMTRYLEKNAENDVRTSTETANDRMLERRMNHGKYASCRVDVDRYEGSLRVRIGYANPKEVIGSADNSCRRFAVYVARVINHMAKELGASGLNIALVGIGDAADVFEEAVFADAKIDEEYRVGELNAKRMECFRRVGNYCSPSMPNCPCYKCGKCVAVELDAKWKSFKDFKKN